MDYRINLIISEECANKIERLRQLDGVGRAEIIAKALAVYDYLRKLREGGARIVLRQAEKETELDLQ